MRTSRHLLRQVRRALLVAFAFSGCINVAMLATPIFTLQVFETVVPTGSIETLVLLVVMALSAIAAAMLLEMVRDRILLRSGLWLDHMLGRHLLENGLKAGLGSADMQAEAKSLATLRGFITSPFMTAAFDAPWMPLFLIALMLLHPMIGLVGIVSAALLGLSGLALAAATTGLQRETQEASERAERWWRTISGKAQTAGALGLARGASEQWEIANRAHIAGAYSLGKRSSVIRAVARAIRVGAQIAVYGLGAWLVIAGEVNPGALVAASILLGRALAPMEQSVFSLRAALAAVAAWRRLNAHVADASPPSTAIGGQRPACHLQLAGATYFHASRRSPSLRGVTLSVGPGETVAIVGPNGAGKSTLAAILAGAVAPQSGTATLDGLPIVLWQRCDGDVPIGYLPDEAALIEGTVHLNIARFRRASQMEVVQAARLAGVHETIAALPLGYETLIGPQGEGLSLRERRAVALARAFFGQPALVVLDEPELGLDGQSVRALIAVLAEIKRRGTALVLATQDQRLLALADRIALLSDGALETFGPAAEVLRRLDRSRPVLLRQPSPATQMAH